MVCFIKTTMSSINYENYGYHNINDASNDYYLEYPEQYFKTFPEFAIQKLNLDGNLIRTLSSNTEERTREEIRDWIRNNLTLRDLYIIGW